MREAITQVFQNLRANGLRAKTRLPKSPAERESLATTVKCPKCGALSGEDCTNKMTGEVGGGYHRVRMQAALQHLKEKP